MNLTDGMLETKVADFVTSDGTWNWHILCNLLPSHICDFIAGLAPPSPLAGLDVPAWKGSHDGNFSIKSAYSLFANHHEYSPDPLFRLIWKWKGIERVRMFLWQMATGSLITNEFRWFRHLAGDPMCTRCNEGIHESILHALRDCDCINQFWLKLVDPVTHPEFYTSNVRDWLFLNLQRNDHRVDDWSVLFGLATHFLWRVRNEELFELSTPSVSDILNRFWALFHSHSLGFSMQ